MRPAAHRPDPRSPQLRERGRVRASHPRASARRECTAKGSPPRLSSSSPSRIAPTSPATGRADPAPGCSSPSPPRAASAQRARPTRTWRRDRSPATAPAPAASPERARSSDTLEPDSASAPRQPSARSPRPAPPAPRRSAAATGAQAAAAVRRRGHAGPLLPHRAPRRPPYRPDGQRRNPRRPYTATPTWNEKDSRPAGPIRRRRRRLR